MRIVAVLQARMNSTRLPGKALKEINGVPILVHIWRRLLACKEVDECVLAWGGQWPDGVQAKLHGYGMRGINGSENDLLERLRVVGDVTKADAILRVRADCLFLDPALLDELVVWFREGYPFCRAVSNWPQRRHSEGVDAEIWSMELLAELDRAKECPREDFGTWAIKNRHCICQRENTCDGSPHLSIDTQEDFDRAVKMMEWLATNNGG